MRAIRVVDKGKAEIVEIECPKPSDNEVLVEVRGSSICSQNEIKIFRGKYVGALKTVYPLSPGAPGHEGSGIVVEAGKNVKNLKAGDAVVMTGYGGPGLHTQYVTRCEDGVTKFDPGGRPVEDAAMMELFGCVYHATKRLSDLSGKIVAISGLGRAGLAAVQWVNLMQPAQLVAIDVVKERLEYVKNLKVDRVVDASDLNQLDKLMKERVDVVLDCSGNPKSMQNAFQLAKSEVMIFGYCEERFEVDQSVWFWSELTIKNSKMMGGDDLPRVVSFYEKGGIDTKPLISAKMPLEKYAEAIEILEQKKAIGIILTPQISP